MSDLSGAQTGDVRHGDTAAGNIYHISQSLDSLVELLQRNLDNVNERVERLEEIELRHAQERQSLTRAIMLLADESATVRQVQKQLDEQIVAEREDRHHRRRYLDRVLYTVIAMNAAGLAIRLVRRPASAP